EVVKLVNVEREGASVFCGAGETSMNEIELDARAASSTGLEPQFAAALAYLAGPFSGLILLLAERSNRFVRFHAWQAIIGLGGLGLLAVTFLLSAFLGLFLSPAMFTTLYWLAGLTTILWLGVWALCLVKSFGGSALRLPLAGRYAERKAARST
ncbi:MAG TPA: hypothetical protein VM493_00675, partial [Vicinamibacterales bacterium]|nr:hypothetical protein [Vicinamibacterales bacterium]